MFVIPLEDQRFLVYAPLRKAAFVANARTVNFLADLRDGRLDPADDPDGTLVEFLRQLEILDAGAETPPDAGATGDPSPTEVTLFLTTACNLRCTYCYAAAGDQAARFMPPAVARRGIDFVCANAVKKGASHFELGYHGGGEPTVNWDTLTGSFAYAQECAARHGLSFRASAATNGVLSDERIDWIVAHLAGCTISFDGLPRVHDRHRRFPSGQGSSEPVSHTLRHFAAANFRHGVRVTVTAEDIAALPDSIEYILDHFNPDQIQVEPVYLMGRWSEAPSAESEEFIAAFREAQRRIGRRRKELMFSGARAGTLTSHFCSASRDGFALSPDGNVSACYEAFAEDNPLAQVFFYGKSGADPSMPYEFDRERLAHLRRQTVQNRDFCRGCFAKWNCGGDCHYKALTVGGPGDFAGTARCHIIRELTKDQILARIGAVGGMFWHEPRDLPPEDAIPRKCPCVACT